MATQAAPLTDAAWTAKDAVLTDHIANEVYAAHYNERKLSRVVIGGLSVLLLGSFGTIVSLSHKPVVNRYVRIDEMGRAQAIQYSDLNYSPREGEVRTYLTDWANYRYTISRDTIVNKYPLNYYFLSQSLASQYMSDDNREHMVSQVIAGQIEQSDVEVRNVTITSMSDELVQGVRLSKGTALVNIDRFYSPSHSRDPRTEHWMLSVTYYLNPKLVSEESRVFPQFETINPLGLIITEFHENRLGTDPIQTDTTNKSGKQLPVVGSGTLPTIIPATPGGAR